MKIFTYPPSLVTALFLFTPLVIVPVISMDIFIPIAPHVQTHFLASDLAASRVMSFFMLGMGIGNLLWGPLVDSLGPRKTIHSSILIYLLGAIGCFYAPSAVILAYSRLLLGIGAAGHSVVSLAILRSWYSTQVCQLLYSYLYGIIAVGAIIAPTLGGFIYDYSQIWNRVFIVLIVMACCNLVLMLAVIKMLPWHISHAEKNPLKTSVFQISKNYNFLLHSFVGGVAMTCLLVYFTFAPKMFGQLGLSDHVIGLLISGNSCLIMLGCFLCPPLLKNKKLTSEYIVSFAVVLMGLGGALFIVLEHFQPIGIFAIILPGGIMTLGVGISKGLTLANALRDFQHLPGTATAYYSFLRFIIPALLLEVIHHDSSYALIIGQLVFNLSIIALIGYALLLMRQQRQTPT